MNRSFCAVGAGATRKGAECREHWSGPEDIVYCVPGCQHHVEMPAGVQGCPMSSLAPTRTGMPYPMPAPSCPPEHANWDWVTSDGAWFFSSSSVLRLQQTADGLGVQHRERGGGHAPADWAASELLSKRNGSRAAARCCLSTAGYSRLTIRIDGGRRGLATTGRA